MNLSSNSNIGVVTGGRSGLRSLLQLLTIFTSGTDKVDLTAYDIESIDVLSMTTGDEGVTV